VSRALGYVYVVVFVREYPIFHDHFKLYATAHSWLPATPNLAATASLFLLHLYFNFAGYMNVVIGIGVLAGLRLPENFKDPFRTANFIDLWSRWHITLSEWFKIYLFNPLLKAMGRRWADAVPMAYLGAISFFITFAVMGIWHGTTGYFLVFGLLLGLGVSVNRLWQIVAAKRLGRDKYRLLCERAIYADASRSTAIAFFSMGASFYGNDLLHSGIHDHYWSGDCCDCRRTGARADVHSMDRSIRPASDRAGGALDRGCGVGDRASYNDEEWRYTGYRLSGLLEHDPEKRGPIFAKKIMFK
jgi:D-alanyl-lipoteichoic acid acyltransferase DltB (MBOAT superfamily)